MSAAPSLDEKQEDSVVKNSFYTIDISVVDNNVYPVQTAQIHLFPQSDIHRSGCESVSEGQINSSVEAQQSDHSSQTSTISSVNISSQTEVSVSLYSQILNQSSHLPKSDFHSQSSVLSENQPLDYSMNMFQNFQSGNSENENSITVVPDYISVSRTELIWLVQETLIAQTMYKYMQQRAQDNARIKETKEIILPNISLSQKDKQLVHNETHTSGVQSKEAQIFRFDKHPFEHPQNSTYISTPSAVHQDVSQKNSILSICASHSLVSDGDSFQLPSQLGLDGDSPLNCENANIANEEAVPQAMVGTVSSRSLGAVANVPPARLVNIPTDSILEEARLLSEGVIQHEDHEESVGVSQEEFEKTAEELEKTKRFLHKLTTNGGISPVNLDELIHLREKVKQLQEENRHLLQENKNRTTDFVPIVGDHNHEQLIATLKKLNKKNDMNNDIVDALNKKVQALQTENNQLKAHLEPQSLNKTGAHSQPPSSVGFSALPPIPTTFDVSCQTDWSSSVQHAATQIDSTSEELKKCQLKLQTMHGDLEQAKKAMEKLQTDLEHSTREFVLLQQKQKVTEAHQKELVQQIIGLKHEIDELKNKNKRLQEIIEDERKRFTRDESELMNRIDAQARELCEQQLRNENLKRLLLAVDAAWKSRAEYGTPHYLPNDYETCIINLQRQLRPTIRDTPIPPSSPSQRTSHRVVGLTVSDTAAALSRSSATHHSSSRVGRGGGSGVAGNSGQELTNVNITQTSGHSLPHMSSEQTVSNVALSIGHGASRPEPHVHLGNELTASFHTMRVSSSGSLRRNRHPTETTDTQIPAFTCEFCQVAFNNEEELLEHLQFCGD